MIEFTVDAIDGNADNVLGASFNWGETGSFTYHEMGTAVLTLIIPDNDAEIKKPQQWCPTTQILQWDYRQHQYLDRGVLDCARL